jgi:hypothetical protein
MKVPPVPQRAAAPRSATPSQPAARISPPPYGIGFVDQSADWRAPATRSVPASTTKHGAAGVFIQPKFIVGAVNDPLEHEADRVADEVMRIPDRELSVGAPPSQLNRKCAACEAEEGLQKKPGSRVALGEAPRIAHEVLRSSGQPLASSSRAYFEPRFGHDFSKVRVHADAQAAAAADAIGALAYTAGQHLVFGAGAYAMRTFAEKPKATQSIIGNVGQAAVPPAVHKSLQSPGQPLDSGTRAFMEPRFGRDFRSVRLHTGSEARRGASAVSARAYTVGNDIVLGSGEHSLHSSEGRHLLAHELTHVVQQHGGANPANGMSVPGDAFERQADAVADAIVGGRSEEAMLARLRPAAGVAPIPSVMRQEAPRPNPAEYQFVPIEKGGTWDAVPILERISQLEYTETRIAKSQPREGTESDPYRCGPSAVLASAIVAGPEAVMNLCVNLYKRVIEWRELAKKDDEAFREKQRDARRAGKDPNAVQKDVPYYDVCDKAAKTVFDIHWNIETGIRYGSHEGGGYTLTFADLDRLSSYLYMFTFDAKSEWRRDAEAAAKAKSPDDLEPDVRSRLEPQFEKEKKARSGLTWSAFSRRLSNRAPFRTESEIGDAAVMAGYESSKQIIRTQEVTDKWLLDWHLDRLKPGQSLLGMWGPHTYTFFRAQDTKIYLYDSWREEVEDAPVTTYEAADSVHEQGSEEYDERIQLGLTGRYKPIKLLLGAAHKITFED